MNLVTHSLGINFYLLAPPQPQADLALWADKIDQHYSETRLELLIKELSDELGARTMSFSSVSYDPFGASANLLIAQQVSALAHLDASHISTHTYFDIGNELRWSSFRLELEISTCGDVHPVEALNGLFDKLKPHFGTIDARSRGAGVDSLGRISLAQDDRRLNEMAITGYRSCAEKNGYVMLASDQNAPVIAAAIAALVP